VRYEDAINGIRVNYPKLEDLRQKAKEEYEALKKQEAKRAKKREQMRKIRWKKKQAEKEAKKSKK
jgi:hypothetical protein